MKLQGLAATLPLFFLVGACAVSQTEDVRSDEAGLVSDATSMVRRPDGRWDVRCRNGRHEVVTSEQITANDVCNDEPTVCVLRCKERWSNGQCKTWDEDYCAPNATCRAHVTERWSNGQAKDFGPDFCTAGDNECVVQCVARWSNGQCSDFGADRCAKGTVACIPHVIERWSDGNPKAFGPDFCKEG